MEFRATLTRYGQTVDHYKFEAAKEEELDSGVAKAIESFRSKYPDWTLFKHGYGLDIGN